MTVREAERVIRSRIERVLESGEAFLEPRSFGIVLDPATRMYHVRSTGMLSSLAPCGGVCAMGAFILGRKVPEHLVRAFADTGFGTIPFMAAELGTSERNVDAIILGFDEGHGSSGPPKGWSDAWYELGQKLRRIYCVE